MDEEKQLLLKAALSHTESSLKEIDKIRGFDISSIPELKIPVDNIFIDLVAVQKALASLIQESQQSKP